MSLARNPRMPYIAAGRQEIPGARMNVRANVYVPGAEAREDCDGRSAYKAPAASRRAPITISLKAVLVLVSIAVFVLAMMYVSAVAKRAALYKEGQALYSEIQSIRRNIIVLQEQIGSSLTSKNLEYRASHDLGMVYSDGVVPVEIKAPDTRPWQVDYSLSAAANRTALDN